MGFHVYGEDGGHEFVDVPETSLGGVEGVWGGERRCETKSKCVMCVQE